jgi:hypothetical protein
VPFFKQKILRIHDCGEKILRKRKFRTIWNKNNYGTKIRKPIQNAFQNYEIGTEYLDI